MHFIKRITFDDKNNYLTSKIIAHTNRGIAAGIQLLERVVKDFVRDERGLEAESSAKIIDIHKIEQVSEPIVDGILLYRLENDPHRILVYQRKTTVVPLTSWTWRTIDTATPSFYRTNLFELEENENFKVDIIYRPPYSPVLIRLTETENQPENSKLNDDQHRLTQIQSQSQSQSQSQLEIEMVSHGPANIKIPKPLTVSPMRTLLDDLKNSPIFNERLHRANSTVGIITTKN